MSSSSNYFCYIQEQAEPDAITLEELDFSHPRSVITIYNGFNSRTKEDYELSSFNTNSLYEMVLNNKKFNPLTREPFDENMIKRIIWYNECLTRYSDIGFDEIKDYKPIIERWLDSPLEDCELTDHAKFFITYDQIIEYFGFKDLDTREKAEEFFVSNPDKTWVIRKSSVVDTKYNQFFVLMVKKGITFYNYLYVHRQGYGIVRVNANRFADISTVEIMKAEYYTNIVDLLIAYAKAGIINF